MTDPDRKDHAAKKMLRTIWNAQIEMLEEAATEDLVMPVRWEELPDDMQRSVALMVTPLIGALNQVMADQSQVLRSQAN